MTLQPQSPLRFRPVNADRDGGLFSTRAPCACDNADGPLSSARPRVVRRPCSSEKSYPPGVAGRSICRERPCGRVVRNPTGPASRDAPWRSLCCNPDRRISRPVDGRCRSPGTRAKERSRAGSTQEYGGSIPPVPGAPSVPRRDASLGIFRCVEPGCPDRASRDTRSRPAPRRHAATRCTPGASLPDDPGTQQRHARPHRRRARGVPENAGSPTHPASGTHCEAPAAQGTARPAHTAGPRRTRAAHTHARNAPKDRRCSLSPPSRPNTSRGVTPAHSAISKHHSRLARREFVAPNRGRSARTDRFSPCHTKGSFGRFRPADRAALNPGASPPRRAKIPVQSRAWPPQADGRTRSPTLPPHPWRAGFPRTARGPA